MMLFRYIEKELKQIELLFGWKKNYFEGKNSSKYKKVVIKNLDLFSVDFVGIFIAKGVKRILLFLGFIVFSQNILCARLGLWNISFCLDFRDFLSFE
jgi:hypothetical protein